MTSEQDQIFAKCAWRLIPFMMLLFVVNYLDRVNVGFAALTLNKQLGFSPSVFGFGAGIFFLGYALCQVPVNVIIERVGATRSVFCIMAVCGDWSPPRLRWWTGPTSFYVLRFLLGVAEAGFFPGMVLYLTLWFPRSARARFTSIFTTAIPLASIIGGPLSGVIRMGLNGMGRPEGLAMAFSDRRTSRYSARLRGAQMAAQWARFRAMALAARKGIGVDQRQTRGRDIGA